MYLMAANVPEPERAATPPQHEDKSNLAPHIENALKKYPIAQKMNNRRNINANITTKFFFILSNNMPTPCEEECN